MKEDVKRKKVHCASKKNTAAREEKNFAGGDYFGDYSPRYQKTYNIYEKAKTYARQQKKEERLRKGKTTVAKQKKDRCKKDEKKDTKKMKKVVDNGRSLW